MARRAFTRELYDLLLAGFREAPGNAAHAGRVAGVDRRTALRGWNKGWTQQYTWAIPLKDALALEREEARLEQARAAEQERARIAEEREQSRKESVLARAQEAQASAKARVNALAMGGIISRIVLACGPLADRLKESLEDKNKVIEPRVMAQILKDCTTIVRQGNVAIRTALEVERLRVGDPLKDLDLGLADMTPEDAVTELQGIVKTLERAAGIGITDYADEAVDEALEDEDDLDE